MTGSNSSSLRFAFLGDFLLGGDYLRLAERDGQDLLAPFRVLEEELADVDILFINLEGPLFRSSKPRPGVSVLLWNDQAVLELLKKVPLCVVNLANNHILDFGPEALGRTLALLKEKGIHAFGAGLTISQASQELILSCKGKRIAFLAFTSDEPHVNAVIAGSDTPGCASFSDFNEVLQRVRTAKSQADIVCISLHWGYEFHSFPAPEQVVLAHHLAEAGATYIIGHHPHVIQGVETFKKSLIMYSLGNFFFPSLRSISGRLQPSKALSREYMILKSGIDDSLNIKSVINGGRITNDYEIVPYTGTKLRQFEKKIQILSAPLNGNDYGSFWTNYRAQRSRELLKESMLEALRKLWFTPKGELLRTIHLSDFRRNFIRLYRILHK